MIFRPIVSSSTGTPVCITTLGTAGYDKCVSSYFRNKACHMPENHAAKHIVLLVADAVLEGFNSYQVVRHHW